MSFAAKDNGKIIGAVLCGHDSRRGYLHHLAVAEDYRRKGVGRALVQRAVGRLREVGVRKCHIFVFGDNADGLMFWKNIGWGQQEGVAILSRNIIM